MLGVSKVGVLLEKEQKRKSTEEKVKSAKVVLVSVCPGCQKTKEGRQLRWSKPRDWKISGENEGRSWTSLLPKLVPGNATRPCSFTKHNKRATTGTTVWQLPSVTFLAGTQTCLQKTRVIGTHYTPPVSKLLVQPRLIYNWQEQTIVSFPGCDALRRQGGRVRWRGSNRYSDVIWQSRRLDSRVDCCQSKLLSVFLLVFCQSLIPFLPLTNGRRASSFALPVTSWCHRPKKFNTFQCQNNDVMLASLATVWC